MPRSGIRQRHRPRAIEGTKKKKKENSGRFLLRHFVVDSVVDMDLDLSVLKYLELINVDEDLNSAKHAPDAGEIRWIIPNSVVRISLLDKRGQLGQKSGLNWGQRPGREKNQAYLPLRGSARADWFLPALSEPFILVCDGALRLMCSVQQQGRKAITCADNSALGRYFRKKLDLEDGSPVTTVDLARFGRFDYTLAKLEENTFFLDFARAS